MKTTIELPFSPEDVRSGAATAERYRGWTIGRNFVGQFEATHPLHDPENDDGLCVSSSTLDGLKADVDVIIEERGL